MRTLVTECARQSGVTGRAQNARTHTHTHTHAQARKRTCAHAHMGAAHTIGASAIGNVRRKLPRGTRNLQGQPKCAFVGCARSLHVYVHVHFTFTFTFSKRSVNVHSVFTPRTTPRMGSALAWARESFRAGTGASWTPPSPWACTAASRAGAPRSARTRRCPRTTATRR